MAETVPRRQSGRTFALVAAIVYLVIAAWESLVGGLSIASLVLLDAPVPINILHWVIGFAALGSFIAGAAAARLTARVIGIVLALAAMLEVVALANPAGLFGYTRDSTAMYLVLHIVTAAAALVVGLAGTREARARRTRATA